MINIRHNRDIAPIGAISRAVFSQVPVEEPDKPRKPMITANLNLIQYINFVLGKSNNRGHDSIFR